MSFIIESVSTFIIPVSLTITYRDLPALHIMKSLSWIKRKEHTRGGSCQVQPRYYRKTTNTLHYTVLERYMTMIVVIIMHLYFQVICSTALIIQIYR